MAVGVEQHLFLVGREVLQHDEAGVAPLMIGTYREPASSSTGPPARGARAPRLEHLELGLGLRRLAVDLRLLREQAEVGRRRHVAAVVRRLELGEQLAEQAGLRLHDDDDSAAFASFSAGGGAFAIFS